MWMLFFCGQVIDLSENTTIKKMLLFQDDPDLTEMPHKRPPPWWGVWGWSPPHSTMGTIVLLVVLLSQQVLGQQQLNIETQEFSITGRDTYNYNFNIL